MATSPWISPPRSDFFGHLLFGDTARFACWLVLPGLWMMVVETRAIASALHPVPRRSARLATSAALALAVILLLGMRSMRGEWHLVPTDRSMLTYLLVVPSILLLALGEEFAFRGVLLSGLMRRGWPFWGANLVVAASFALSHWPGWVMFGGIPLIALATATLRVFVFGLAMGGLVRLEGGLIAAILVHFLNDLLTATVF